MLKGKNKWPIFGNQSHTHSDSLKPSPVPIHLSPDAHKFGLENFGNTCYANSVLQALYFCGPFRDLLIQTPDTSVSILSDTPPHRKPEQGPSTSGYDTPPQPPIPSNPPGLFSALRSLFLHISSNPSEKGTVGPKAFIDKLRELNELFRSNMHQDAHEFLNYLLNKVVEEIEAAAPEDDLSNSVETLGTHSLSRSNPKSTSGGSSLTFVHKIFEGVLTSETRCLTCETVSARDESFLDLSIDIEQNSSLTACLRQFSASEMLSSKNKFFCDSCCDLQEAEKRMKIKKLPNVLALHLKRFKFQEDTQKFIKLAYRVAFPFELRLFNTVDEADDSDRLYNLYAIVVHIGAGPHHGHYISIIKTMGTWLVFDDDTVSPIAENDIPKYFGDSSAGSAYVLYYQATEIDLAALGFRTPPHVESTTSSLPTTSLPEHIAESLLVPPSPTPAIPPGLVDEGGDISDQSDPALPSRLSAISNQDKPLRSPVIDVNAANNGVHDPSHSPLITPTAAISPKPSKGLFDAIRRSPSTYGTTESDPSSETSGVGNVEDDLQLPPPILASGPPLPINGKEEGKEKGAEKEKEKEKGKEKSVKKEEKEKEKRPGWFGRRRSLRTLPDRTYKHEEPFPPSLSPILVQRLENHASSPSLVNGGWFKSMHSPTKEKTRRPSDLPPMDISSFSDPLASTSTLDRPDLLNGNSHSDASSSRTSEVHGPLSPSMTPSFPPTRSSSIGSPPPPSRYHSASGSQTLFLPPKRSTSSLSPASLTHLGSSSHPSRTFTPGETISSSPTSMAKELPPVPALPKHHLHGLRSHHRKASVDFDPSLSSTKEGRPSPLDESKLDPRHSRPPDSIGASPVASQNGGGGGGGGSGHSSSSNLKRATRKLSLSAPFLGLGKKDKEKKDTSMLGVHSR